MAAIIKNEVLCEDFFYHLAEHDPSRLIELLKSEMSPANLTFAAEIAGREVGKPAIQTLLTLLSHESALVREGAVYGLVSHWGTVEVGLALIKIAADDPSPGVREAAREIMEESLDQH